MRCVSDNKRRLLDSSESTGRIQRLRPTEMVMDSLEHIIVSELDHDRIASLRKEGFVISRIAPNHFGDESCSIDGFVMVRRS